MSTPTPRHVALVGPTAAGKSALALELARRDPRWEIVSVDSMQVYRGMDIGTAKPSVAEQRDVRHHLIDLVDPDQDVTVVWFQDQARRVLADIEARGGRALLVGGTGLYHRAVVDDLTIPGEYPEVRARLEAEPDTAALHARLASLDPAAAARMEPGNRRRVVRALEVTEGSGRPFSSFGPGLDAYPPCRFALCGVDLPSERLRPRIARRFADQLAAGLLDEVRDLRARPSGLSRTAGQALGYKELWSYLDGTCPLDRAVELVVTRTRQFARRQRAWFRRDPRVRWVDPQAGADGLLAAAAGPGDLDRPEGGRTLG
ncbi:MAG: tRNA (adenosine(37)-N6)-dimethylallyltransferase MiaA [Acidimicrobiia bacterium]